MCIKINGNRLKMPFYPHFEYSRSDFDDHKILKSKNPRVLYESNREIYKINKLRRTFIYTHRTHKSVVVRVVHVHNRQHNTHVDIYIYICVCVAVRLAQCLMCGAPNFHTGICER